jgi:hypothetical protein
MAKTPPKDYYASVIAPNTKKIEIVSRRLGTKERLVQIAVCTNEGMADIIVEALNLRQGVMEELTAANSGVISDLRTQLQSERAIISGLRTDVRSRDMQITELKSALDRATRERDACRAADIARGAAATPA